MKIRLCAYCQEEFPTVRAALTTFGKKIKDDGIVFSHGMCMRHYKIQTDKLSKMMQQSGKSPEQIQAMLSRSSVELDTSPDLKEHPELVAAYSQGIFSPKQIRQAKQTIQESNDNLTDRFKTLAGIHS